MTTKLQLIRDNKGPAQRAAVQHRLKRWGRGGGGRGGGSLRFSHGMHKPINNQTEE
jgi:hypothetical protein